VFNENWVGLSVFAALLGFLLHQTGLLAVAVFLLTAAAAGWLWSRYSLHHLEYERSFSETRAFSGETIDITLQITNRKLLPISWLQVDDEYTLPLAALVRASSMALPRVLWLPRVLFLRTCSLPVG